MSAGMQQTRRHGVDRADRMFISGRTATPAGNGRSFRSASVYRLAAARWLRHTGWRGGREYSVQVLMVWIIHKLIPLPADFRLHDSADMRGAWIRTFYWPVELLFSSSLFGVCFVMKWLRALLWRPKVRGASRLTVLTSCGRIQFRCTGNTEKVMSCNEWRAQYSCYEHDIVRWRLTSSDSRQRSPAKRGRWRDAAEAKKQTSRTRTGAMSPVFWSPVLPVSFVWWSAYSTADGSAVFITRVNQFDYSWREWFWRSTSTSKVTWTCWLKKRNNDTAEMNTH